MELVPKPPPDSIPRRELVTPWFASQEIRASHSCALLRLCSPRKLRSQTPGPSLSRYSCNGRWDGAIFVTPECCLQSARSVELWIKWSDWTRQRNFDCPCLGNAKRWWEWINLSPINTPRADNKLNIAHILSCLLQLNCRLLSIWRLGKLWTLNSNFCSKVKIHMVCNQLEKLFGIKLLGLTRHFTFMLYNSQNVEQMKQN